MTAEARVVVEAVTRVKRHAKLIPLRHGNLIPFPRAIQSGLATAIAHGEVLAASRSTTDLALSQGLG